MQPQALPVDAIIAHKKMLTGVAPKIVEQKRILERALRKQALGQARQENNAKLAPASFVNRADKNVAVTPLGWFPAQKAQAFAHDLGNLFQGGGPDLSHRLELGQDGEHRIGPPQRHAREIG